jgi:hypothetical protein
MLSPILYWTLLFGVATYAFMRGRMDERFAAAVCVLATIGTFLLNSPLHSRFEDLETGLLVVDFAALAGFTWLALRSERFWPLWVAGLQLTTILSHFLKFTDGDMIPKVYAAAERFWVYPIFLIIVIGTWRSSHRSLAEQDRGPLTG